MGAGCSDAEKRIMSTEAVSLPILQPFTETGGIRYRPPAPPVPLEIPFTGRPSVWFEQYTLPIVLGGMPDWSRWTSSGLMPRPLSVTCHLATRMQQHLLYHCTVPTQLPPHNAWVTVSSALRSRRSIPARQADEPGPLYPARHPPPFDRPAAPMAAAAPSPLQPRV
ncbi:hypothetical protein LY78DRAFT_689111, partial [Colletotrichum sublineola]